MAAVSLLASSSSSGTKKKKHARPSPPLCLSMQAVRRAQRLGPSRFVSAARLLGGTGVPQEWGQPRSGGTGFLGTPDNYTQLLQKRPISPDLFGVEGTRGRQFRRASAA